MDDTLFGFPIDESDDLPEVKAGDIVLGRLKDIFYQDWPEDYRHPAMKKLVDGTDNLYWLTISGLEGDYRLPIIINQPTWTKLMRYWGDPLFNTGGLRWDKFRKGMIYDCDIDELIESTRDMLTSLLAYKDQMK